MPRYTKIWLSAKHIDCGGILDQKTGRLSIPYTACILAGSSMEDLLADIGFLWGHNIKNFNPKKVQCIILDDDFDFDLLTKLLFLQRC